MENKDRNSDRKFCKCNTEIYGKGVVCSDCEAEQYNCPYCLDKHSMIENGDYLHCSNCGSVVENKFGEPFLNKEENEFDLLVKHNKDLCLYTLAELANFIGVYGIFKRITPLQKFKEQINIEMSFIKKEIDVLN